MFYGKKLILLICFVQSAVGQRDETLTAEERHLLVLPGSYGTPPTTRLIIRCPSNCSCYARVVFCSGRDLREIPVRRFPREVAHLFMEKNLIEVIPGHVFARHPQLTRVTFRWNRIRDSGITQNSFAGLNKLKRLDLGNNEFTRFPSGLPESLQELDLSANNISEIPPTLNFTQLTTLHLRDNNLDDAGIEPGTFKRFQKLTNIDLNNNSLTTFPRNLPTSIQYLRIENNGLNLLPDGIFSSPSEVHHVFMRANQLQDASLPPSAWKNMSKLYFVDFSQNLLRSVPRGLPQSVRLILLENNLIEELHWQSFWGLRNLEQIRLSFNQIARISVEVFPRLAKLRYLSLSFNKLTHVPQGLPKSLLRLYLDHNNIYTIPYDAFCDPYSGRFVQSKLQLIRLDSNKLHRSSSPAYAFYCLPSMHILVM